MDGRKLLRNMTCSNCPNKGTISIKIMKNYIAYPSLVCEECIGKMKVKTVSGWANGNLETYEVYEL